MLYQRLCYLGILLAAASLAPAQQQDFSKVEIHTTRLAEGLYVLQGSGGNITASVGADGVLLVDSEFAPLVDTDAFTETLYNPLREGHVASYGSGPHSR